MSWKNAAVEWIEFSEQLEQARKSLHCSYSSTWYRGHSNTNYKLIPTLFRRQTLKSPEATKLQEELKGKGSSNLSFFTKHSDISNQIRVNNQWLDIARLHKDFALVTELERQLSSAKHAKAELRARRDRQKLKLRKLLLIPPGEREAFLEYSFRSGNSYENSWETLAEMQHHGVPTRLLDWTEVRAVALYFAVSKYRESLQKIWGQDTKKKESRFFVDPIKLKIKETPSVWIFNPYRGSKLATDRRRVWDFTKDKRFDYYDNIIVQRDWKYNKPIPIYSPWKNSRIAAQQGMFTVFGHSKEPLDSQFDEKTLREIKIPPMAAIYCVKHLIEFCGIDHFTLFRDLDSLAKRVKAQFMVP